MKLAPISLFDRLKKKKHKTESQGHSVLCSGEHRAKKSDVRIQIQVKQALQFMSFHP